MTSTKILFSNGVVSNSSGTPPVSTFLQTHPGAYTTTRTYNNGSCLMFWDRHLQRLANSARILFDSHPQLLFKSSHNTMPSLSKSKPSSSSSSMWESMVKSLVNDSMNKVMPIALKERRDEEELAVTVLFSGDFDKLSGMENVGIENMCKIFDVHVHLSGYVPPVFGFHGNGVSLAVVGRGRDVAEAKYSDWVRLRKSLEKLRPPTVTELLLSNNGDQILEGSVTNFFVVCRKDNNETEDKCLQSNYAFEVQTAPISDGALPGVIRQLVIEVCLNKGIPVREVAPSWSKQELWEEAFITSSLRILQHVESIQVPIIWGLHESKCWNDIAWKEKQIEESPGMITQLIQKEIMARAGLERNI
ncbi:uncharacterized protein LOC116111895 isoform X1 [Pistacia vera]|uniref:uncharacterized protein LOC116111895 isoform X1 n=2 Tax=Pistacia vera TaxID=55513 RepID=UPI0012632546|nr:uncharacterized protein LOC116111895 isoform X1 [Pistacia vera]XP_031253915.1 uncharacterized protein LOC116111895 isoform X1 [Pistacia vera]XP_031253916.1 uncharacterized protein LOC116111895 isoform X1 [Pistacia vera]XP_031253917.1 uncharacterized protein LOC116111895 isoform X1 [Pistacia vera]XP_031253918.1 uncharacterized protein LOC116111895 isoform X1 [Pistacia vera]